MNASAGGNGNEERHGQNVYLEEGVNPLYEADLEMVRKNGTKNTSRYAESLNDNLIYTTKIYRLLNNGWHCSTTINNVGSTVNQWALLSPESDGNQVNDLNS